MYLCMYVCMISYSSMMSLFKYSALSVTILCEDDMLMLLQFKLGQQFLFLWGSQIVGVTSFWNLVIMGVPTFEHCIHSVLLDQRMNHQRVIHCEIKERWLIEWLHTHTEMNSIMKQGERLPGGRGQLGPQLLIFYFPLGYKLTFNSIRKPLIEFILQMLVVIFTFHLEYNSKIQLGKRSERSQGPPPITRVDQVIWLMFDCKNDQRWLYMFGLFIPLTWSPHRPLLSDAMNVTTLWRTVKPPRICTISQQAAYVCKCIFQSVNATVCGVNSLIQQFILSLVFHVLQQTCLCMQLGFPAGSLPSLAQPVVWEWPQRMGICWAICSTVPHTARFVHYCFFIVLIVDICYSLCVVFVILPLSHSVSLSI